MKIFTATFYPPNGGTAAATARFASLPGESAIAWSGDVASLAGALPRIGGQLAGDGPPVEQGHASTFVSVMQTLGSRAGARVEIQESGIWEVYEE